MPINPEGVGLEPTYFTNFACTEISAPFPQGEMLNPSIRAFRPCNCATNLKASTTSALTSASRIRGDLLRWIALFLCALFFFKSLFPSTINTKSWSEEYNQQSAYWLYNRHLSLCQWLFDFLVCIDQTHFGFLMKPDRSCNTLPTPAPNLFASGSWRWNSESTFYLPHD